MASCLPIAAVAAVDPVFLLLTACLSPTLLQEAAPPRWLQMLDGVKAFLEVETGCFLQTAARHAVILLTAGPYL